MVSYQQIRFFYQVEGERDVPLSSKRMPPNNTPPLLPPLSSSDSQVVRLIPVDIYKICHYCYSCSPLHPVLTFDKLDMRKRRSSKRGCKIQPNSCRGDVEDIYELSIHIQIKTDLLLVCNGWQEYKGERGGTFQWSEDLFLTCKYKKKIETKVRNIKLSKGDNMVVPVESVCCRTGHVYFQH